MNVLNLTENQCIYDCLSTSNLSIKIFNYTFLLDFAFELFNKEQEFFYSIPKGNKSIYDLYIFHIYFIIVNHKTGKPL